MMSRLVQIRRATPHTAGTGGDRRQRVARWTAFAVVYLVWGSTYLAIKVMVGTIPPLLGAGVRFLVAGLLLAGWVTARHGRAAFTWRPRQLGAVALTGLLLVVGGPGLTTVAEQHVPSGLAALLVASVPLWVVLWRLAAREHVGLLPAAGVVLGLVGVGVLVWPAGGRGVVAGASLLGVGLLLVVALSYATGSFLSPRLPLPADTFSTSAAQMLLAGLTMTAAGLLTGEASRLDFASVSSSSVWALSYLIGPGSLLAYTAYVWLLAHVPVAKVTTYAHVNPVVAVLLGWLVLSEQLTARILVGAALTLAGVAAVVTTARQPH